MGRVVAEHGADAGVDAALAIVDDLAVGVELEGEAIGAVTWAPLSGDPMGGKE